MANVGVTFDFAAESAKLRTEIDKVRKELSSINKTTKAIGDGFSTMGKAIVAGFSVGAVTAFLGKVNANIDALNDLAGRMGATASGLQSLQVAASLAGGSAEGMNTALVKMSTTIGDAVTGNKAAAEAFSRLGLSARELAALRPDEAFRRISDATASIPNSFERASVAQDIFGKGAKEIAGLLSEGGSAIDAVNAQLAKQGALLSNLDVAKIGVMNDELQFQETVVTNLGAKFISGFSPAVGAATGAVSELLGRMGGATEAGQGFGVVMVASIKIVEASVYGLAATFELLRASAAAAASTIVGGFTGIAGPFGTSLKVITEAVQALTGTQEAAKGIGASLDEISKSAFANAKLTGAYAIDAASQIVKAGEIFQAAQASYEQKAAAAAARNAAAQGASSSLGALGYDPAAARLSTEIGDGTDRKAVAPDFLKDATTDPKYLYQQTLGASLAELATAQAQEQFNIAQVGNASILDSLLLNNDMMIAAEQAKNMTLGQSMGQLVSMAIQQGGTMGKFGKAYAIASTVWSTGEAVMKSFKNAGGYPWGIAPAAAMAAQGAAQLANIRKTNIGSGSSVLSPGGGGASVSSPALSDNVTGTQRSTESDARSAVTIVVQGNLIESRDTATWLAEVLGEAINGRDLVFINGKSRQALEIAGT